MPEVIRTDRLSKSFDNTLAVDSLSIHVNEGEIFGFLGVNGAGKTTTIGMLLGMIRPTAGEIIMLGKKVTPSHNLWGQVGYQVGSNDSYPNLTIGENLGIVCRYRKISGRDAINDIIERLNLTKFINKKAGELSLGNLQRLAIAKALIHKPKLLILDEPTNGLDPVAIVEIRKLLRDLADRGSTIFMSSHILSEVSQLATRIAIIHDGRLTKEVTTADLEKLLDKVCIVNTVDNRAAVDFLKSKGVAAELSDDGRIHITDPHSFKYPEHVSALLFDGHFPIKELRVKTEDLESFFLRSISGS